MIIENGASFITCQIGCQARVVPTLSDGLYSLEYNKNMFFVEENNGGFGQ
jgi:hypothetical protein